LHRCDAELRSNQPPLALKTKDMLVTAKVWQPTVLTTEFTGPLTVAQPGQPPFVTVSWQYARTELHGLPIAPESATIRLDRPLVDRDGATMSSRRSAPISTAGWCPARCVTIR